MVDFVPWQRIPRLQVFGADIWFIIFLVQYTEVCGKSVIKLHKDDERDGFSIYICHYVSNFIITQALASVKDYLSK